MAEMQPSNQAGCVITHLIKNLDAHHGRNQDVQSPAPVRNIKQGPEQYPTRCENVKKLPTNKRTFQSISNECCDLQDCFHVDDSDKRASYIIP